MPVRLLLPARTFFKIALLVLVAIGLLWLLLSLADLFILIAFALLLAAVLEPAVAWIHRKGLPRGIGAVISVATIGATAGGIALLVAPEVINQAKSLFENLPELAERLRSRLGGNPVLYQSFLNGAGELNAASSRLLTGAVRFSFNLLSTTIAGALLLTLCLYFLTGGNQLRQALIRLTPPPHQSRFEATVAESARVIRRYFVGQAIVSALFASFVFVLLSFLGVPYAMLFAVLAFFLDAVPNVGAMLAILPPAVTALAESTTTAAVVLVASVIYQQIENNMIGPRVLSARLRVPPIATMVAILAGGKLLGIAGVILAIPLAGMLPVVERIWIIRHREEGGSPPLDGSSEERGWS